LELSVLGRQREETFDRWVASPPPELKRMLSQVAKYRGDLLEVAGAEERLRRTLRRDPKDPEIERFLDGRVRAARVRQLRKAITKLWGAKTDSGDGTSAI
jgi:hypothetical protein